jgi:hypothetical protein
MEVVQDEQSGLMLQTTIRGVTFRIDAALIGTLIGTDPVPLEGGQTKEINYQKTFILTIPLQ